MRHSRGCWSKEFPARSTGFTLLAISGFLHGSSGFHLSTEGEQQISPRGWNELWGGTTLLLTQRDIPYPLQQRDFHKSCLQESSSRGWKTLCDPIPAEAKQTEAKPSKAVGSDRRAAPKQSTCKLAKSYIPAAAHPNLSHNRSSQAPLLPREVGVNHRPSANCVMLDKGHRDSTAPPDCSSPWMSCARFRWALDTHLPAARASAAPWGTPRRR